MPLNEAPDDARRFFQELAVDLREGRRRMAVNVDLAHHLAPRINRNNDLGVCLERAGEIARVRVHVVHHNRLSRSGRGSANPLRDGDACVRGRIANKSAEDQSHRIAGVEHVKAGPIVMRKLLGDGLDDASLQGVERGSSRGRLAETGEQGGHLEGEGGHVYFCYQCGTEIPGLEIETWGTQVGKPYNIDTVAGTPD